jgi:hypothetical protein
VDFPWSMWAIMLKLRIKESGVANFGHFARKGRKGRFAR